MLRPSRVLALLLCLGGAMGLPCSYAADAEEDASAPDAAQVEAGPVPQLPELSSGHLVQGGDGLWRCLVQPEFRTAASLLVSLGRLKLPGLTVSGMGPEVFEEGPDPRNPRRRTLLRQPSRLLLHGARGPVEQGRAWLARLDRAAPLVAVSVLVCEVAKFSRDAWGSELLFDKGPVTNPDNTLFRSLDGRFDPADFLAANLSGTRAFEGTSLTFADPNTLGTAWEATLRALVKCGHAQFVTWPNLVVAEQAPATLEVTENVPLFKITTADRTNVVGRSTSEATGVRLALDAVRIGEETAVLDLRLWLRVPEPSESGNTTEGALIFKTREVKTRLSVRDGEPLLFGGLHLRRRHLGVKGIPFVPALADIGGLPGSRDSACFDTEMIFLLRPRILRPALTAAEAAQLARGPAPEGAWIGHPQAATTK